MEIDLATRRIKVALKKRYPSLIKNLENIISKVGIYCKSGWLLVVDWVYLIGFCALRYVVYDNCDDSQLPLGTCPD